MYVVRSSKLVLSSKLIQCYVLLLLLLLLQSVLQRHIQHSRNPVLVLFLFCIARFSVAHCAPPITDDDD